MKLFFTKIIIINVLFTSILMAKSYEVEQLSPELYSKMLKRVGTVAFKRTIKLSFKSSGYLTKLDVDEGDYFDNNVLLASLDTQILKSDKNTRYIQLLQAKREVTRVKALMEKSLSSQQALDLAQTKVDTAREAYKIAYYNLDKAEIHATFKGVVLSRYAELGEYQSPGKNVLEVAAVEGNLIVKVRLTADEVSFVKLGQKINIDLPHLGEITGTISKIPAKNNDSGQSYLIEILLDGITSNDKVVAGQLAQVKLLFSTNKHVYKMPISALVKVESDQSATFMLRVDQESFDLQSFNVLSMDNQFLYVEVNDSTGGAINVVTNGWQQLLRSEL